MAEWLRSGLQIRARRFDSGSGLHLSFFSLLYSFFLTLKVSEYRHFPA